MVRIAALALAALCALSVVVAETGARPQKPPVVRIAAVGDMAMAPAFDGGATFFSRVRGALRGDVVLGNLEGTLTTASGSKCTPSSRGCFSFRAPPTYARILHRAGFTILNLANNHALDYGRAGQAETVAALDRAGLRHTGRPAEIAYLLRGGVLVAVIGFAPYPWAQNLLDAAAAKRIVRRAARHADVVVVTMHAGAEGSNRGHVRPGTELYLGENRGNPIAFAHAVVDAGADLVIGHGPHVLRGLEWYRGRLIAYSLGNFLGNGTLSISGVLGVSAVLQVRLRQDGSWISGSLVPVRLVPPGLPARDPERSTIPLLRRLSSEDFGRRAVRVSARGVLRPGQAS